MRKGEVPSLSGFCSIISHLPRDPQNCSVCAVSGIQLESLLSCTKDESKYFVKVMIQNSISELIIPTKAHICSAW